ncbi:alpha/beta fold hydrolase [Streptomyces sp. NPDC058001]|uniref:alpha/beta fold hydrolase n=1 Tax=Streptomyces sp. NPDC058001 TaxID=3346300 RepID=UPI0036E9AB70
MLLQGREWGCGERVVVLVHGIMSDHRTWWRVGPALASRGYRVIGVDLRGHGASGRGEYGAELFADDLVETVPTGAELVIGHSLGGLAVSLAVERLAPARVVYADPAWALGTLAVEPAVFVDFRDATREMVVELNPGWADADVDVELATLQAWDPDTAFGVTGARAADRIPEGPAVPSLVVAAGRGSLVSDALKTDLTARGFTVRTVPGAGHTLHRDDFDGFFQALDGWI